MECKNYFSNDEFGYCDSCGKYCQDKTPIKLADIIILQIRQAQFIEFDKKFKQTILMNLYITIYFILR
jgi:hypothetical protein